MILLRHGQSEFNLHFTATRRDPGIIDPRLTPLGHDQARQAAEALAGQGIRRIIVSPYTRALQTAAPVAADDYLVNRETGSFLLIDPQGGNTLAAGLVGDALAPLHLSALA